MNDVWFDVPATPDMETKPKMIQQGHMDMVSAGFGDPVNECVTFDCDETGKSSMLAARIFAVEAVAKPRRRELLFASKWTKTPLLTRSEDRVYESHGVLKLPR